MACWSRSQYSFTMAASSMWSVPPFSTLYDAEGGRILRGKGENFPPGVSGWSPQRLMASSLPSPVQFTGAMAQKVNSPAARGRPCSPVMSTWITDRVRPIF